MLFKALFFLLCSAFSISQSFAFNPPTWTDISAKIKKGHPLVQAGWFEATEGKNQHINITGLAGNLYTVTSHTDASGLFGWGYLLEGMNYKDTDFLYGLNAFYLGTTSISGTIYQEDFFGNFTYRYKNTYYPLYVSAKSVTKLQQSNYALTFDIGIGPDFIQSTHYQETSLVETAVPDFAFSSHTTTAFGATVGVGLKLPNVLGHTPLECGYRFFYLGQGHLSIHNDLYINQLQTGDDYASAVMCTLTI